MHEIEKFLINTTESIEKALSKDNDFSAFIKTINNSKFKRFCEYNSSEAQEHLLLLKNVLDKITSIVFNPHIESTTEEVITRSELTSQLSNESFRNTIRDSRLWKIKEGTMVPEYVHTSEHIDTIVTYENTFISRLVDFIYDDINEILSNLSPLVKSIEMEFETKGISYGIYSPLNNLETFKYPYKIEFLKEKMSTEDILDLITNLTRKIKNIKASEFYKLNHKNKIESNIVPTNILIHDNLYSSCYRFYLDTYIYNVSSYSHAKNIYYYNYVLTFIFDFIKEKKLNSNIKLSVDKDNRLNFDEISFIENNLFYVIKEDKTNLAFSIEVSLNDKGINSFHSNYYYLVSMKYDEANAPNINDIISKKLDIFTDVTLITQNNLLNKFKNVMNVSIYQSYNEKIINNMFTSLSLIFETDPKIYEHKCPVCGSKKVEFIDDHYACKDCHSKYSLLKFKNKPVLWIKSFRRN